jgi:Pyruvate/2-oxoacid:ferredoxin oxidoreductase delta subunit
MRYGLTGLEWVEIASRQRWSCAICLAHIDDFTLVTDHDHESGKVRGLLCNGCNMLLGMAKDSPIHLVSAAVYLQRNGKSPLPNTPARNPARRSLQERKGKVS